MNSNFYNEEWPISPSGYSPISPIGLGTFGFVWKYEVVSGPKTGIQVAIKRINLEDISDVRLDELTVMKLSIRKLWFLSTLLATHVCFLPTFRSLKTKKCGW